jgi:RNA polymerase sigma-70 factor (ECF subfamily)
MGTVLATAWMQSRFPRPAGVVPEPAAAACMHLRRGFWRIDCMPAVVLLPEIPMPLPVPPMLPPRVDGRSRRIHLPALTSHTLGNSGMRVTRQECRVQGNRLTDSDRAGLDDTAAAVAALLARVAGRDEQAFEALYRLTSARLLGIGMRVLGDRAEAEDVLQDVYITVWAQAGKFDIARASAWTWLGTIVRNRAIDRLRAAPSKLRRAPIELAESLPDPTPSPAAQADAGSQGTRLDDCLGRLEPRGQSLIRTAFFEGATYDELATRTGSPLGSVKSWIRRGLLQLRECLER